jgi:uncharacterized membrane protein YidH (DUF202 family)
VPPDDDVLQTSGAHHERTGLAWRRTVLAFGLNVGLLLKAVAENSGPLASAAVLVVAGAGTGCWAVGARRTGCYSGDDGREPRALPTSLMAAATVGVGLVAVADAIVIMLSG